MRITQKTFVKDLCRSDNWQIFMFLNILTKEFHLRMFTYTTKI